MLGFQSVWERIQVNAGREFRLRRGGSFIYQVQDDAVVLYRNEKIIIPKSQFEKAWLRMPLKNTQSIKDVRGPSYIYAILMDKLICLENNLRRGRSGKYGTLL